ncbi:MAG: LLM class flavin-dependent oxidoreductase [Pseudomonadota bacterium]
MIPYSLLDLCPIAEGSTAADSFRNARDLAWRAESWGYTRYWVAEHHNMPGIASAATALVIGHVAEATSTLRVGSGGIMLPNHSPLVVAEQFGTLAEIHGPRIDLGLGRAPGTDPGTARALRRGMEQTDRFPHEVMELMGYLDDPQPGQAVRAVPGQGTKVPVWILGSSLYGAQLAAHLGLPYAFASHFAPQMLEEAAHVYRESFRPSAQLAKPHFMMAINVFAAESEAEARRVRSSSMLGLVNLRRGRPGPLPRPVDDAADHLDSGALAMVEQAQACTATGTPEQVRDALSRIIDGFRPDEVILAGMIHDHQARLRSFEIAAEILQTGLPSSAPQGAAVP